MTSRAPVSSTSPSLVHRTAPSGPIASAEPPTAVSDDRRYDPLPRAEIRWVPGGEPVLPPRLAGTDVDGPHHSPLPVPARLQDCAVSSEAHGAGCRVEIHVVHHRTVEGHEPRSDRCEIGRAHV